VGFTRSTDGAVPHAAERNEPPEGLIASMTTELLIGVLIVVIVGFLGILSPWQSPMGPS
jgi:hypothetical protein